MTNETKTAAQIAEDAKQAGLAAGQTLSSLSSDAASMVKAVASDAKSLAGDAIDTARSRVSTTAKDALDGLKPKATEAHAASMRYVSEEPGKAVFVAFVSGVILGALIMRSSQPRRWDY